MNRKWQWTRQSMTCQLPSSVLAPSSSFLTPRCSSAAPANDSWPRHASPVNTGAEHFMILAFYAQQQWTEERDTSWPRKSIGRSRRGAIWELEKMMNIEHEQKVAMDRAEHDLSIAIFSSCSILYISNPSLLLWSSCQCFSLATTCLSCEHWC